MWGASCVRMAMACAHARPIVARLWKKYAARRKVKVLSVGSSPKVSKNLTAWRWELSVSIMIVGVVVVVGTVTVVVEVGLTNYVELIDTTFSGARGVD